MSPDLGFVVDAAEGEPHELAAQCPSDRLTEAGLPDARRSDETENRRPQALRALADGHVFQDPFLDLLDAIVVLIEHLRGHFDVPCLAGRRSPGQGDQPIHVGPNDANLGRGRRNALHPVDFFEGALFDAVRHPGRLDFFPQAMQVGAFLVLAEFFANGF